jgi:teichuronic acid biosynthesis glycosyltransferase TuaG
VVSDAAERLQAYAARPLAAVTVVIPCYRDAATIERSVGAAFAQTWQPAEVIVIDDFSDDIETSIALDRLSERAFIGLKVIRLAKNLGASGARNTGWEAATQQFVAFLDADDVWAPRKLELQLPLMRGDASPTMSGHRREVWPGTRGASEAEPSRAQVLRLSSTQLLFRNMLPTSSVILRRDIPYRFNPERRYSEDYELWLRVTLEYGEFVYLDEALAFSYKASYGESGLSSELRRMEAGQTSVYLALFRDRTFGWAMLVTLLGWGKARYARRLVITLVRKALRR